MDLDDEMIDKLSSILFKIIHSDPTAAREADEVSHHSSQRPVDSQDARNLEQRVNNNMGIQSDRSEYNSVEEDGSDIEIDGMHTTFANAVDNKKQRNVADILENAQIDSKLIKRAVN